MLNRKNKKEKTGRMAKFFGIQILYKHLAYVLFLAALCLLYIANAHRAEKKVRKIQSLQKDVSKKEWNYWEENSKVMFEGIQSQTEKRVKDLGLEVGEESIKVIEDKNKKKKS